MPNEKFKVIYENDDLLVIDKPAGIVVFPEKSTTEKTSCGEQSRTIIDYLLERFPYSKNVGNSPRYGIVHRLDKDTSGILLVAKNYKTLEFLQKQFQARKVIKNYLSLLIGNLKADQGRIETLIGRSQKNREKQRVYLPYSPEAKKAGKRSAITEYRVKNRFRDFTLVEVSPKTGRKHQIRCHFSYLGHPIAGDKLYGFKGQLNPKGLNHQFLHANYLKIKLPDGKGRPTIHTQEFRSELPEDLKKVLKNLKNET